MTAEAYPLAWPAGESRTGHPGSAQFGRGMTQSKCIKTLFSELRKLGASHVVLSTNMIPRKDKKGYLMQAQPQDRGAAVYFMLKGTSTSIACDRWNKVHHNIRAIAVMIESIRRVERCGTSGMVDAMFRGFQQLPERTGPTCWDVLGLQASSTIDVIKLRFSRLAKIAHPDKGGSDKRFDELVKARDEALQLAG